MSGFVYFIRPVDAISPIKIGYSEFPVHRLRSLMTWAPVQLEIVATAPATAAVERQLHDVFAYCHSHGEWFTATDRLLALVAAVAGGADIASIVDLSKPTGSIRKGITGGGARSENGKLRFSYKMRVNHAVRRASKRAGHPVRTPADIVAILHRWSGHWRDMDGTGKVPTDAEFERLDEFIEQARAA